MNFNTRADEVKVIVSMLESGEYETSKQLAEAIMHKVVDLLADRDMAYGVGIGLMTDDVVLSHGPYYHLTDAKKVRDDALERGLRAFIAPLLGPTRTSPVETDPEMKKPCKCGHLKFQHWDRGKCAVFHRSYSGPPARTKPNWPQCGCSGYEKD